MTQIFHFLSFLLIPLSLGRWFLWWPDQVLMMSIMAFAFALVTIFLPNEYYCFAIFLSYFSAVFWWFFFFKFCQFLKQCSVLIRIPVNSLRSKLVKFFFIYANLMNYINWFTCDVTLVTNYVFKDRFIPLLTA